MHDTACCFGYPSDLSRAEQQRDRDSAFGASTLFALLPPRRATTSPPPPPLGPLVRPGAVLLAPGWSGRAGRALSTVTAPGPLVRPGSVQPGPGHAGPGRNPSLTVGLGPCGRPLSSSSGRRWALPFSHGLGLSAGLLVGASGCQPVSPLSFSPIVQWGGFGLARRQVDRQQHCKGSLGFGVQDPVTGVVRWAGVVCTQQRATASASGFTWPGAVG
jgi:hypothetical protein